MLASVVIFRLHPCQPALPASLWVLGALGVEKHTLTPPPKFTMSSSDVHKNCKFAPLFSTTSKMPLLQPFSFHTFALLPGVGYAPAAKTLQSLFDVFLLKVEGSLGEVGGAAEVAPVVFVGAEGEDFFALGGEAKIGVDDGEDVSFGQHRKKTRGNDVDAGEGEGR